MTGRIRRDPLRGPNRGFTMVELLIVVAVLAILASVAIVNPLAGQTQSLESVARVVAADLRLARSLAVQHGTEWTVRFDTSGNRYELVHTGTGSFPAPDNPLARPGDDPDRYVVELDQFRQESGAAIRLASARLAESGTAVSDVTFGPTGGTGPSRNEDTAVWLVVPHGDGVRSVRLVVSWVTGQVWAEPADDAVPN